MNKAVFLDKDGTLIKDVPYNVDPERVEFTEGSIPALALLSDEGYLLIVVSNQSGVAHGYFTERELESLRVSLEQKLAANGIALDAMYFCPHHPAGKRKEFAVECECRKPKPGMILKAAEEFNVDLSASWMIGDILNDVEAGNQAGCQTILINNGNETEWHLSSTRKPTIVVQNLYEAAEKIVGIRLFPQPLDKVRQ